MSDCYGDIEYSILVLKCQQARDESHEIDCLRNSCKLMGISCQTEEIKDIQGLDKILSQGEMYDFIYLSAHGNPDGFTNSCGDFELTWKQLATMLCQYKNMNNKCILMLSCCRGGLDGIAYTFFHLCQDIHYVAGPREELSNCELSAAFHIFLFNYHQRNLDAVASAKKVKKGIGTRLICYDRLETTSSHNYTKYVDEYLAPLDDKPSEEMVRKIIVQTLSEWGYKPQLSQDAQRVLDDVTMKEGSNPATTVGNCDSCF